MLGHPSSLSFMPHHHKNILFFTDSGMETLSRVQIKRSLEALSCGLQNTYELHNEEKSHILNKGLYEKSRNEENRNTTWIVVAARYIATDNEREDNIRTDE